MQDAAATVEGMGLLLELQTMITVVHQLQELCVEKNTITGLLPAPRCTQQASDDDVPTTSVSSAGGWDSPVFFNWKQGSGTVQMPNGDCCTVKNMRAAVEVLAKISETQEPDCKAPARLLLDGHIPRCSLISISS